MVSDERDRDVISDDDEVHGQANKENDRGAAEAAAELEWWTGQPLPAVVLGAAVELFFASLLMANDDRD